MGLIMCDSENAISHHGMLHQIWGVRNGPPYPLNRAGKAALRKQKRDAARLKKLDKQQRAAVRRELKAERKKEINAQNEERRQEIEKKRAEKLQRNKEKIMRSASANELAKYQGLWSNEELQYIANRLRLESDIASYQKEITPKLDKFERIANKAGRISDAGEKYIKFYNTGAKLINSALTYSDPNSMTLPIVGQKGGEQKKKQKNDGQNKNNNN